MKIGRKKIIININIVERIRTILSTLNYMLALISYFKYNTVVIERRKNMKTISTYLPYIVSVVCALISGIASYLGANKKAKSEIKKIEKQHVLDIEKERQKFELEKEKLEIQFKHQLELKDKEIESQVSANLMDTVIKEAMNSPEIKKQFQ